MAVCCNYKLIVKKLLRFAVLTDAVFLNVSELSGQSQRFSQRLREAVEIALEQGDEDLLTVDVGKIFLDKETEEMMDAFRRYCVRSVSFLLMRLLPPDESWPMNKVTESEGCERFLEDGRMQEKRFSLFWNFPNELRFF